MNNGDYTPRRITVFEGDTRHDSFKVSVFASVGTNGLAYYRWLNEAGKKGCYKIVHVASGWSVIPPAIRIRTPKKCRQIIALLDPLTDWRQPEEAVMKTVTLASIYSILSQMGLRFFSL